jgi:voltage-gated potassium channel
LPPFFIEKGGVPLFISGMVQSSKEVLKQSRIILYLAIMLILFGVGGYMILEEWSFLDSLYMTVITITTVGFREARELGREGQIFTIVLITFGVGTWAFAFTSIVRLLVEGHLKNFFSQRRMERMIGTIRNHFIVCGFGRIGSLVCRQLEQEGLPFVVIEKKPSAVDELARLDYMHIGGDATEEETLKAAGIGGARCLISVLGTDAGNVYAVLSARHLNPRLYIVCRSEDDAAEDKMLKAGANKVICPYRIGGRSLANAAARPNVVEFIEFASTRKQLELGVEEVPVPPGSPLAGQSLMSSKIRERFGVMIVACRTANEDMIFNPPANHVIKEGDVLIAMGKPDSFERLHSELD